MSKEEIRKWKRVPFSVFGPDLLREMDILIERMLKEEGLPEGAGVLNLKMIFGDEPLIKLYYDLRFKGEPSQIKTSKPHKPIIEIIDSNSETRVIADIPGAEKDDIKIQTSKSSLMISIDAKRYHKKLRLPAKVDPRGVRWDYRNGILEVILKKR